MDTTTPSFSGPAVPARYVDTGLDYKANQPSQYAFGSAAPRYEKSPPSEWVGRLKREVAEAMRLPPGSFGNTEHMEKVDHLFQMHRDDWTDAMRADPAYENRQDKKWVNEISNCFDEDPAYDDDRGRLFKRYEQFKDVFWYIIAGGDPNPSLFDARERVESMLGNTAADGNEPAIEQEVASQYAALTKASRHTDGNGFSWATQTASLVPLNSIAPTLLHIFSNIFDKADTRHLLNIINKGDKWKTVKNEGRLRSLVEAASPSGTFFDQAEIQRRFGRRSLRGDSPEELRKYCKVFDDLRVLLFKEVEPACSNYEKYDDTRDKSHLTRPSMPRHDTYSRDPHVRQQSRAKEYQYTPEVPTAELGPEQKKLVWMVYCPLVMGVMYPWFSQPDQTCKDALVNNLHSTFVLASHGISKTGECMIQNIVPFVSMLYNVQDTRSDMLVSLKVRGDSVSVNGITVDPKLVTKSKSVDAAIELKGTTDHGGDPFAVKGTTSVVGNQWGTVTDTLKRGLNMSYECYGTAAMDWEDAFEAACDPGRSDAYMHVTCGMEYCVESNKVPPMMIVKKPDADPDSKDQYWIHVGGDHTSGIACHTKNILHYYMQHYKMKLDPCDVHDHNMLLERVHYTADTNQNTYVPQQRRLNSVAYSAAHVRS